MATFSFDELSGQKPVVSLIIPTLNEEKNLPLLLPYIPMDMVDEVILVDGMSKDHTIEVAKSLLPSIRVIVEEKKGKGSAMRRGYAESIGDIIVVMDADGSHDPREIPRFVQALLEGADFVKGSRFNPAGGTTDMPRLRIVGNWGLTMLVNILFTQHFTDLCYGYHAFWRHCLEYINLEYVDGFEIDTSIYLQAVRNHLKVVEVPSFEGLRFYGWGKLQTFPDGARVLRTIFQEWITSLRHPASVPSLGFRSYQLGKYSTQNPIPVTGFAPMNRALSEEVNPKSLRKRYRLEEFFDTYLKNLPKEEREALLSTILVEVAERMGASSGSLLMLNDVDGHNDGHSVQVFGRTPKSVPADITQDMLQNGIAGWAVQNNRPLLIPNTSSDPHWLQRDWEQEENAARTAMAVPFFQNGKPLGVIILARPEDRAFTNDEVERIQNMEVFL